MGPAGAALVGLLAASFYLGRWSKRSTQLTEVNQTTKKDESKQEDGKYYIGV